MSRAFSLIELVWRLIFILFDMYVNNQTLVTKQPFFSGVSKDYVSFIVIFNAGMIFFIFLIDLIDTALRRIRTNYTVGEGLTDLYKHEQ